MNRCGTKLIEQIDARKEIVQDVDGFRYFVPYEAQQYSAHHLRWIADELDKRNLPLYKQIEKDFGLL